MTTQYYSGPTYRGRFFGFLLALALGAAACIFFVRHATTGAAGRIVTLITGRTAGLDHSVTTVVDSIHRLGRLQTVVYSLDTVVDSNPSPAALHTPDGDSSLLIVHGESIAGMDLSQLKPEDVRIDFSGHGIHVTLPASQLFSTTLVNQRTRAYSGTTGALAPPDQTQTQPLEPNARARAQDQLQQTALTDGILDAASRNARAMVIAQLHALGFEQVEVQ